jgi:D-glycero-beta-D-manno-heptose-7-phosphate kinase
MSPQDIFKSFTKQRVLIVGDVMLDRYIWGSNDRMSPEAPVPIITVNKRDHRPGGAGNVAQNILALGATPILCALVGKDEAGARLKECLQKQAISTEGLIVSNTRPTTEKTRVIAQEHHIVRVDEESDAPPSAEEEEMIVARVKQLLSSCTVVIFQDYDKGALSENIIRQIVSLTSKAGIPTVVDPKKRNFKFYKGVTLFKPNLKELREGLQVSVDPRNTQQLTEAVSKLKSTLLAKGVMTTLSEHGVYIDYDGQTMTLPAHARHITDVSGAGDTVVAVAALCVAIGLGAKEIAQYSNLAGGLVCQHVGVVPVDRQELINEITRL